MDIIGDTFDGSAQSLSMDLLDTDVFFSTEQLGVGELDMAGLTDVDLSNLDNNLDNKLGDTEEQIENWSNTVDLDLQPSDLVQFGDTSEQPMPESDTASNQGCLDDDFQRMLSDWESHIGALSSSADSESILGEAAPDPEPQSGSGVSSPGLSLSSSPVQLPVRLTQARQLTQLPVSLSASLRTPVVPRPGVTYTRVAGLGPRVAATRISHIHSPASPPSLPIRSTKVSLSPSSSSKDWYLSPNSSCPTATLPDNVKFSNCTVSDLSRTLENQKKRMQWLETNFNRNVSTQSRVRHQNNNQHSSVKIIAAVSPGKNGQSTTRILSTRHDSLPRELIEKIKAASQGRKTIAIIEPINKERHVSAPAQSEPASAVRSKSWISTSQPKWRHVGIVSPLQSQNMSDHDYCSPTKTLITTKKIVRSISPSDKNTETVSSRGRDSGLESDGSDNSEDGGLYDKLPPYLTSVSVQTGQEVVPGHYSRVPYYMTTTSSQPRQTSLLKTNVQGVSIKQEPIFLTKINPVEREPNTDDLRDSSSEREIEGEGQPGIQIRKKRSKSPSETAESRSRSNSSCPKYRRSNSRGQRIKNWRNSEKPENRRGGERGNSVEERKIVYVGKIDEGTLKADLRNRFQTFGPIIDVSIHFRERGDNYGFITFENKEDAYVAVEHGNDDPNLPEYDLCFGGRRAFCKDKYFDLDYVEEKGGMEEIDFDKLLEAARGSSS